MYVRKKIVVLISLLKYVARTCKSRGQQKKICTYTAARINNTKMPIIYMNLFYHSTIIRCGRALC